MYVQYFNYCCFVFYYILFYMMGGSVKSMLLIWLRALRFHNIALLHRNIDLKQYQDERGCREEDGQRHVMLCIRLLSHTHIDTDTHRHIHTHTQTHIDTDTHRHTHT